MLDQISIYGDNTYFEKCWKKMKQLKIYIILENMFLFGYRIEGFHIEEHHKKNQKLLILLYEFPAETQLTVYRWLDMLVHR